MRGANASTIEASVSSKPCSSSRATTAQLARETTCERTFAMRPSLKSGNESKSVRAIDSSSTESPRNSSRSYDSVRSAAHDEWVKTAPARSGGSASISSLRVLVLLVGGDVVDGLTDGRDLLRVLVRDLDPELILELHDQLDQVERVRVEVVLERRLLGDLIVLDTELFRQNFLDALEDLFTRRGHVTASRCWGRENATSEKRRDHTRTRSGSRSDRRSTTRWSTPRAASRIAFPIAARPLLPCAITARP